MRIMASGSTHKATHLTLDELTTSPSLARRLPVDLARRFHAVPLAEDGGRITVAMADPDDMAAREAIASILGPALYVVQAETSTIDTLVAEIWGEEDECPLNMGVCDLGPAPTQVWDYAQPLAALLGARISRLDMPERASDLAGGASGVECDLVIAGDSDHPLLRRILLMDLEHGAASEHGVPARAVLIAQRPRWPLKRILLILCGEEGDSAAVEWVLRLARPSGSVVTVLAVVPPAKDVIDAQMGVEHGLPGLLSSDTPLGRQMQGVARHLVNSEIEGTLRLRQGPPDLQIGRELAEGEYDLVAVPWGFCWWWRQRREVDLLSFLLQSGDRPVLVVTPDPMRADR
jgi:hypothetical protein